MLVTAVALPPSPLLLVAQAQLPDPSFLIAGCVIAFVLLMVIFASRYRKVPPNQILVVSGMKRVRQHPDGTREVRNYRMIHGGGTFVMPTLETADTLSLEAVPISVEVPGLRTSDGKALSVFGTAQVRVGTQAGLIDRAVERLLSKSSEEIGDLARAVLESHLRRTAEVTPAAEFLERPESLSQSIREAAAPDLAGLGLECGLLSIHPKNDEQSSVA